MGWRVAWALFHWNPSAHLVIWMNNFQQNHTAQWPHPLVSRLKFIQMYYLLNSNRTVWLCFAINISATSPFGFTTVSSLDQPVEIHCLKVTCSSSCSLLEHFAIHLIQDILYTLDTKNTLTENCTSALPSTCTHTHTHTHTQRHYEFHLFQLAHNF
jgi:hypothetical protein